MYLVAIAWIYVALMMAVAEATSTQGSLLGAFFTFVLYGLLPVAVLMYILGTPSRRALRRRELALEAAAAAAAQQAALRPSPQEGSAQADDGGHAAAGGIAAERKES
jgi:hypothetical protein